MLFEHSDRVRLYSLAFNICASLSFKNRLLACSREVFFGYPNENSTSSFAIFSLLYSSSLNCTASDQLNACA